MCNKKSKHSDLANMFSDKPN